MQLFSDIKIKTKFWLDTKFFRSALFNKTDSDRFALKFLQKSELNWLEFGKLKRAGFKQPFFSKKTGRVFLKLLDAHGEIMLKKVNRYDFKTP